jgi:DNA-binding LytR/AlgR family response regulator
MAELGEAGARVHRSWWVARGAAVRLDGQTLVLRNGLSVPVGRTYLQAAREAGIVPRQ